MESQHNIIGESMDYNQIFDIETRNVEAERKSYEEHNVAKAALKAAADITQRARTRAVLERANATLSRIVDAEPPFIPRIRQKFVRTAPFNGPIIEFSDAHWYPILILSEFHYCGRNEVIALHPIPAGSPAANNELRISVGEIREPETKRYCLIDLAEPRTLARLEFLMDETRLIQSMARAYAT